MGVAIDSLRPPSVGLQRNQWCTFSFLPQQWCCTIKVDTKGKPDRKYMENDMQSIIKNAELDLRAIQTIF